VLLRWYMNQEDVPLAPMQGTVVDHFALAVTDLDAWIARLQDEDVTFLEGPVPYLFGDTRAVMIEGPSHEAIELIEVPQASPADLSPDAAAVLELDRAAEDALNRMDTELLSTIYADDLVFTHGEAWTNSHSLGFTTSKAEWLEFIANSDGMFTEKNANTQRIEMHGDVAIVQGRSSGRNKGEAYEIWYLRVYEKREGNWKLISHKTVRGPQPPTTAE
jgi:ketosteroid isomerase-like protein